MIPVVAAIVIFMSFMTGHDVGSGNYKKPGQQLTVKQQQEQQPLPPIITEPEKKDTKE